MLASISILYAALASFCIGAELNPDFSAYSVTYFGDLTANITMSHGFSVRSDNRTESCPPSWHFSHHGAVLKLSPYMGYAWPKSVQEAQAMDVVLRYDRVNGKNTSANWAIFKDIFISNGSVSGPFENGYKPSEIVLDKSDDETDTPSWTVNGTQASFLLDDPRLLSRVFSFNCSESESGYCGNNDDRSREGCWPGQRFNLNSSTPANFTIRFDDYSAWVDIWMAQPWVHQNGTNMGDAQAHVQFKGGRDLPSDTDNKFWDNNQYTYEMGRDDVNDIQLKEGSSGMPLFYNNTNTGEWYSAGNGTYSASAGWVIGVPDTTGIYVAIAAMGLFLAL